MILVSISLVYESFEIYGFRALSMKDIRYTVSAKLDDLRI